MAKKKETTKKEEKINWLLKKEYENKLKEIELPECDGGQSRRQNEMIDLLKQIVNQNEQLIQLLEKLKNKLC